MSRRKKSRSTSKNRPAEDLASSQRPASDLESASGPTSDGVDSTGSNGNADSKPANQSADHDSTIRDLKQSLLPKLPSLSRIMSVVMLLFGILAVGALFYRLMSVFFVPLFLAALLVVIFRPLHQWTVNRLWGRQRIAAASTTVLIAMVVLVPILLLLSVAATQFTAALSKMDFDSLDGALDRARQQLSLTLPHAAHFRELDETMDSFGDAVELPQAEAKILKVQNLVRFLQEEVDGPVTAVAAADEVDKRLEAFLADVRAVNGNGDYSEEGSLLQLNMEEEFDRHEVYVVASVRNWMQKKLGGAAWSQLRLLANPSEADFSQLLRRIRESLQPRFVELTSKTGGIVFQFVVGLCILIVSVYFFLTDGPAMIRTMMRLSPLDDAYEHRLLMEFDRTSRAVVLASVLSALAQGFLAAIGFYFTGFDSVVLLFLITTVMSLIPFLGAASVWVPCAIWLGAVEQKWWLAIGLAIYGAVLVSSIDNVIKMFVLHGRSQLHPLFALLSVLGGVTVFGPIGILVGPMVVVFLQTLLEILNHELAADA